MNNKNDLNNDLPLPSIPDESSKIVSTVDYVNNAYSQHLRILWDRADNKEPISAEASENFKKTLETIEKIDNSNPTIKNQ